MLAVKQREVGMQAAAIFDLDGVLVLSARAHEISWALLLQRHGRAPAAIPGIGGLGIKSEVVIADLLQWTQDPDEVRALCLEKEEIFRQYVREHGIDVVHGAREFISELARQSVPLAVGSSAPRENVELCLEVTRMRKAFSIVVTGDQVARGKPAPDIFLQAAAALEVRPEDAVVFEDAPAGIAAAHAAGMRVIGVLTNHTSDELNGADAFIRDFSEVTADRWLQWATGNSDVLRACG